ncbi:hypothetical protein B566_EDAN001712 [Ephemera danica]|nr:hypothetical protein B566_EDAN001712 [Ephemera danica]
MSLKVFSLNFKRDLEETNRKIQKEIKHYAEGMINLNKAELKLTSDLSSSQMCHQEAAMRELVEEYLSVTSQVSESVQEVSKICQRAILDPSKKFAGEFSGIAAAIQKREQALNDVTKHEIRQRKLESKEKIATNVLKIEQSKKEVQQAKEEVKSIHSRLVSELPQFYAQRSSYFTPCLQALIRAQVDYHGVTVRLFTHLTNISASNSTLAQCIQESETQYQERLNGNLAALQALRIVRQPT